jgi:hypothetical protein
MQVEEITDKKCHLKKNVISFVNSAIGVLGPPGAGKSSLCCAYYKIKFNMDNSYFQISSSGLSFTKGIWILKEEERMKIKENIDRDILDVEGFQVDEIKSWKYVMVISFICSQIIILNRNTRLDDTKKVLNIIKNSLKKMRESNIPKILKTIYIQIDDEDDIPNFDEKLKDIGYAPNSIESITIKPIYIPTFDKKTLKKNKGNILNVEEYLEDVKNSLQNLSSDKNEQSISTFIKYIDNLNMALDGKMNFDAQGIIQDLKDEYEVCYETWKNKKKKELMNLSLSDIDSLNETYDDYINKQNLDFSFKENLEELTFFGSSDEFDKYYREFGKSKDFQVEKSIFNDVYETKKNEKEIEENRKGTEEQKKLSEIEEYFERKKRDINQYLGSLKFYDSIDSKSSHCDMNINTDLYSKKNEFLQKLYDYYESKTNQKKRDWESQINRAKYKAKCQAQGTLECVKGHKLNGEAISCHACKGDLYWVDGPTHYSICSGCQNISKLTKLVCGNCEADVYCEPKFTDYIP